MEGINGRIHAQKGRCFQNKKSEVIRERGNTHLFAVSNPVMASRNSTFCLITRPGTLASAAHGSVTITTEVPACKYK